MIKRFFCGILNKRDNHEWRIPMSSFIDLSGRVFNNLTVIKRVENPKGKKDAAWLCQCKCGDQSVVVAYRLKNGNTKSCGCIRKPALHQANTKHGKSKTVEYATWNSMMQRCYNPNAMKYSSYGSRGIVVCERWHEFENFLEDMGMRPDKKLSLERIDPYGNYGPDNCKWGTKTEQSRNTRSLYATNTSGARGVHWDNRRSKWIATIKVNGKKIQIGEFKDKQDAIAARTEGEKKIWGVT